MVAMVVLLVLVFLLTNAEQWAWATIVLEIGIIVLLLERRHRS